MPLSKKTIGDWTEQRLAQFVQSLPAVARRRDDTTQTLSSVAGGTTTVGTPTVSGPASTDDGIWWDGFVWIAGKVTNARVAASAAIAYSKLNLAASIVNADIANAAAIAYSKLNLAVSLLNADVAPTAAIRRYKTSTLPATAVTAATRTQLATDDLVPCDATANAITFTLLPAATAGAGNVVTVKKIDASGNAVTVDGDGAETLDGATTFVLAAQWKYVELTCTGTAWYVTANN